MDFISHNLTAIVSVILSVIAFVYGYATLNGKVSTLESRVSLSETKDNDMNTLLQHVANDVSIIKNDISWMRASTSSSSNTTITNKPA